MAITSNTYTGNGTNKLFSITFPYLDTSDINVYLNGVLQTITTQYTFANATTVEFVTAPSNGAEVLLDRSTDDTALQATFFPGSSIKAADLNDNFDQTLYVVQEINNKAVQTDDPLYANKTYIDAADATKVNKSGDSMSGVLTMGTNKITNLGTPSIGTDAATKTYVDDNAILYSGSPAFTQDGTGAVTRSWSSKLKDAVNVRDFGAVGNGVVDDAPAIQAAVNYLFSLNGGILNIPPGTYLVGSTIDLGERSINVIGSGATATIIKASHSAGPVIRIKYDRSSIRGLQIDATTARNTGAAGNNFGILEMPADSLGREINGTIIEQVVVVNQPSHGIALVTGYKDATIRNSVIFDCKGHGIWTDDGSTTALQTINFGRVGGITISHTRVARCTGHAWAIGLPASPAYRITVDNCDLLWCALSAGVRYSAHTAYMYCENAVVINNAIAGFTDGGFPTAGPRVQVVRGIFINGQSARVQNNRFIDCLGTSIELGASAPGSVIEDVYVSNSVGSPQNPAVLIASGCAGVTVNSGWLGNIDKLASNVGTNTGNLVTVRGLLTTGYRSGRTEIEIPNNTFAAIPLSGVTRGILVLNGNNSSARSGMFAFRAGDANAYVTLISSTADAAGAVGIPTGTTGTVGNLTVFASNSSPFLYIENRRGATGDYMPTFLSLAAGELVL